MNERTFDDFDEFAGDYRSIHTRNLSITGADSFYFAEQKVLQVKKYEQQNGLSLLDVGCGDGSSAFFFHHIFPSWKLEGIDVSKESVEQAKSKNLPSANFAVYDGKTIPFSAETFDIVFIAAVLHHINFSEHEFIMNEMFRVLKPGGRLYLFEHNPLNPITNYLVRTCPFDVNARLLPYRYTQRLLGIFPFKFIEKQFTIFFPRKGIFKKMLGVEDRLGWLPLGGQYFFRAIK
jgi:ubiquinone/menaquinone biosynthesis C-methylase UbiE